MDQNAKKDRAQKLKSDKRNKEVKRSSRPGKSNGQSSNVQPNPSIRIKGHEEPTSSLVDAGDGIAKEFNFSHLKRETDAISEIAKTYSKREISSNWAKYETPLPRERDMETISQGADFEALLSAPVSEGGHFKFKCEKMWALTPPKFSNIFTLDVKNLAKGLACIPFYKQVDLPIECFSQKDKCLMDEEAALYWSILALSKESPEKHFENLRPPVAEIRLQKEEHSFNKSCAHTGILESEPREDGVVSKSESSTIPSTSKTVEILNLGKNKDVTQADNNEINTSYQSTVNPHETPNKRPCKEENISTTVRNKSETLIDSNTIGTLPGLVDDDELDFLLTLKEPISRPTGELLSSSSTASVPQNVDNDSLLTDLAALSLPVASSENKEELEDWLDNMLDD